MGLLLWIYLGNRWKGPTRLFRDNRSVVKGGPLRLHHSRRLKKRHRALHWTELPLHMGSGKRINNERGGHERQIGIGCFLYFLEPNRDTVTKEQLHDAAYLADLGDHTLFVESPMSCSNHCIRRQIWWRKIPHSVVSSKTHSSHVRLWNQFQPSPPKLSTVKKQLESQTAIDCCMDHKN
jgi:hypothetical protein